VIFRGHIIKIILKLFKYSPASFSMEFRELSNGEWEPVRSFLLLNRGVKGLELIVEWLNGIRYVLVTGRRWMDIPHALWALLHRLVGGR
jgi:hypothetical protein